MKRPTKKSFYEYMSIKYDCKFKSNEAYMTLLDVIQEADKSEKSFMDLAELTLMNKTDRLIYRNTMAVLGTELTPVQLDQYISTIEYALEYIS